MLQIVIAIISSSALTAIITNLINRRGNKAKAQGQELINTQKLIEISNQMIDELADARDEISKLRYIVDELTKTNAQLQCQLKSLKNQLKKFSDENKQ